MSTPSITTEQLRARFVAEQAEKRRLREEEDARGEREFAEGLKRAEEEAKREQEEEAKREQEEASKRIAERQRLLDLLEKESMESTKKAGKRKRVEEPAIASSSVRIFFFISSCFS